MKTILDYFIKLPLLFLLSFYSSVILAQQGFADQVETVVQTGHNHWIRGLILSRDNKYLVSWSNDKTTIIWDMATTRQIRKFAGHKDIVQKADISSDNKYLITFDFDMKLIVWEAATGKINREIDARVFSLSLDGSKLYYMNLDFNTVCLPFNNLDTPIPTNLKLQPGYFFNEKEYISFDTHSADLIDSETGIKVKRINQGGYRFYISPDKKYYITGKEEKYKVYNYETGLELFALSGFPKELESLAIHPLKPWVCGRDYTHVYVWDYTTGSLIKKLEIKLNNLAFTNDGRYLVGSDLDVYFVNAHTWEVAKEFKKYSFSPDCMAFNPSGTLFATGYRNGQVKVWDMNRIKIVHHIVAGPEDKGDIFDMVFSPDGNTLITGGKEQVLKFWDVKTGKEKTSISFSSSIDKICISPNGKTIACARGSCVDGTYLIFMPSWEKKTPEQLQKEKNERLDQYGISVIDISAEPRLVYTLKGHESNVRDLKFAPDGKCIASGGDKEIILWDPQTGQAIKQIPNPDKSGWISSIDFDNTGQQFMTGSLNGEIKIWNKNTGEIIRKWQAHTGSTEGSVQSLIFHNQKLISSSPDETIKFWDISTGNLIKTLTKPYGGFDQAALSPDGKWFATAGRGGQVSLWLLKEDKEKLILAGIGNTDFMALTPEGYYTASPEASRGVHFVKGMKIFTFENFDILFNRPDKVLQSIGIADQSLIDAYYRAWKKRIGKMGFTENHLVADLHLPEVNILDEIPMETSQKNLNFNVLLSDSKYKLSRLNLYVNDVPVYGMKGDNFGFINKKEVKKNIRLQLNTGRNYVQVSTHNENGIESLKQGFEIFCTAPALETTLYAVCIGVSDYLNYDKTTGDLNFAAKDAMDLGKLLQNQSSAFTNVKLIPVTDKDAIKSNIHSIKDQLLQSDVNDGVLLFFAGHGLLDNKLDYYLATYDVNFEQPSENGLPYEELENLLDSIPARRKLMFIDACHSGEVDKEETVFLAAAPVNQQPNITTRGFKNVGGNIGLLNSFELMQELFGNIQKGTGAVVITSASGVEVALESSEWNNGAFTYTLLQGLKTTAADKNGDGTVSVSEVRNYIIENVDKITGGRQHPTTRKGNLEFDFKITNLK